MPSACTLIVQSPTHVGTGQTRNRNRVIVADRTAYIPDLDAYFEQHPDELSGFVAGAENGEPVGQYLPASSRFSKYTLDIPAGSAYDTTGQHEGSRRRSPIRETKIHTVTKDGQNQPYIPGSSIKGAIRTALAHRALSTEGGISAYDIADGLADGDIGALEEDDLDELFILGTERSEGTEQHRDMLRCLKIHDATPDGTDETMLALRRLYGYNHTRGGIREQSKFQQAIETVEPGTQFTTSIRIDTDTLREMIREFGDAYKAAAVFGIGPGEDDAAIADDLSLPDLSINEGRIHRTIEDAVQNFAEDIVSRDRTFFSHDGAPDGVEQFYKRLDVTSQPYLRLGHWTGFHSTTALLGFDEAVQIGIESAQRGEAIARCEYTDDCGVEVSFVGGDPRNRSSDSGQSQSETGSDQSSTSASSSDTSSSDTKYGSQNIDTSTTKYGSQNIDSNRGGDKPREHDSTTESHTEDRGLPLECPVHGRISVADVSTVLRYPKTRRVVRREDSATSPLGWVELQVDYDEEGSR